MHESVGLVCAFIESSSLALTVTTTMKLTAAPTWPRRGGWDGDGGGGGRGGRGARGRCGRMGRGRCGRGGRKRAHRVHIGVETIGVRRDAAGALCIGIRGGDAPRVEGEERDEARVQQRLALPHAHLLQVEVPALLAHVVTLRVGVGRGGLHALVEDAKVEHREEGVEHGVAHDHGGVVQRGAAHAWG